MFRYLYIILFVVSIINLIIFITSLRKQVSFHYVILFLAIIAQNLGYVQLVFAKNIESALYANQIAYLGAVTIPFFSAMCILELCNEKHNKLFESICIFIILFIYACVCTVGKLPLYYKDVNLVIGEQYTYFAKEYGPLHIIYPTYLIAMVIYGFWIVIKSYKKRRKVSHITSIVLTVTLSTTAVIYFGERIFNTEIEFMPVAFVDLQISLLILLNRINRYDLLGISTSSISESKNFGFIIYSSKGKLLGIDEIAREWFPELNNLYIDYKIKDTSTDFLKLINDWIENNPRDEINYFERANKIIEVKRTVIIDRHNNQIFCINLRDDTHQQKLARFMKNYNENLNLKVKEKTSQLSKVQNDIIISMASIVENRDGNTGGHIKRTSEIVKIFVSHLLKTRRFPQITPEILECIIKAAPLHDFGKIAIPDVILNKPGKFTPEEYEIMKLHPGKGAVIVSEILQNSDDMQFRNIAVNVAHYHHEKWDGTGYPTGISQKQIPFEARVMALADVFDALVSKRVYKDSFSYDKAFIIIEESCGTHFDPDLCTEFLKCRTELENLYNSFTD